MLVSSSRTLTFRLACTATRASSTSLNQTPRGQTWLFPTSVSIDCKKINGMLVIKASFVTSLTLCLVLSTSEIDVAEEDLPRPEDSDVPDRAEEDKWRDLDV